MKVHEPKAKVAINFKIVTRAVYEKGNKLLVRYSGRFFEVENYKNLYYRVKQ